MKCPKCGSEKVSRYSNNAIDCNECKYSASAQAFGAKCTCEQPHHLPVWYCEKHGEVIVPMD
jgi:hypothetical protein